MSGRGEQDSLANGLRGAAGRARDLGSKHIASVIAVTIFGLVAVNILAFADYSPQVALSLLARADTAQVLLAVAFSLVHLVVALGLTGAVAALLAALYGRRLRFTACMVFVLVSTLFLLTAPLSYLLAPLGFLTGLLLAWVRRRAMPGPAAQARIERLRDETSRETIDYRIESWAIGAIAIAVLVFTLFGTPWLPIEVLTVNGQSTVAYTIGDDGRWYSFMRARDKIIQVVASDAVTSREPCDPTTSWWNKTAIQLSKQPQAGLPQCPAP